MPPWLCACGCCESVLNACNRNRLRQAWKEAVLEINRIKLHGTNSQTKFRATKELPADHSRNHGRAGPQRRQPTRTIGSPASFFRAEPFKRENSASMESFQNDSQREKKESRTSQRVLRAISPLRVFSKSRTKFALCHSIASVCDT
jgi:hypothetical protein